MINGWGVLKDVYGLKSFTILARRAGYEIVSYETVISEIGFINDYLSYHDPYLGPTKNRSTIANLISEDQIFEQNLGYKIQTCLRLI